MGSMILYLEYLMNVFFEFLFNKNFFGKESLNLEMCVWLWVVVWFVILFFVWDLFLGVAINSIILILGL